MRYLVPQFLETEQRIWGPFTFTNFVILIGVGGVTFMLYFYLSFAAWLAMALVFGAITLAFMFYRHSGRALPSVLKDLVSHLLGVRRYTWAGMREKEDVSEFIAPTKTQASVAPDEARQTQVEKRPPLKQIEELSKMLDS